MGRQHGPQAGYLLDTWIGRDERDRVEPGWPASCHVSGRRDFTVLELLRWSVAGFALRIGFRRRLAASRTGRSPRWKRDGPGARDRLARGRPCYVGESLDPESPCIRPLAFPRDVATPIEAWKQTCGWLLAHPMFASVVHPTGQMFSIRFVLTFGYSDVSG